MSIVIDHIHIKDACTRYFLQNFKENTNIRFMHTQWLHRRQQNALKMKYAGKVYTVNILRNKIETLIHII